MSKHMGSLSLAQCLSERQCATQQQLASEWSCHNEFGAGESDKRSRKGLQNYVINN